MSRTAAWQKASGDTERLDGGSAPRLRLAMGGHCGRDHLDQCMCHCLDFWEWNGYDDADVRGSCGWPMARREGQSNCERCAR